MTELGALAERLQRVRQQIADAGGAEVQILAVTKGHPKQVVDAARAAGLTSFGENYAQELVAKFADKSADVALHFIGQLQTNKVRQVVDLVDVYETVDRPSLVVELAKRAPGAHVLVQVDTTGEPGKGGCAVVDVESLVTKASVGGSGGRRADDGRSDGGRAGGSSAWLPSRSRGLCDSLGLATCSMGMSDDFIVAVQEGSTRVRFGQRPFRHASSYDAASTVISGGGGPRMPIWRNAMDWLGLGPDDAYDDYDTAQEPERPSRSPRHQREEPQPRGQRGYQGEYESDGTVRTMPARPSYPTRDADLTGRRPVPASDDSNVQPRPINTRPAPPVPPIRTPFVRDASIRHKKSPTSSKRASRSS